jgi:hypothetical protein
MDRKSPSVEWRDLVFRQYIENPSFLHCGGDGSVPVTHPPSATVTAITDTSRAFALC